jgi:hypothetical protein
MYVFLIYIFILTSIYPQTRNLDQFLDIRWKSIRAQVKLLMLNNEGVELTEEKDDIIAFSGGMFSGNEVKLWSFHFYDDKFYNVDVVFDTIDGEDSVIWHKAFGYLIDNYGETKEFEKIDKNKTVIFWYFYDDSGDLKNLIQLVRTFRGSSETEIQISYTYIPLFLKKEGLEK